MLLDQSLVVWQGEMSPFNMLLFMNCLWEAHADACFKKGKSCQFCPFDIHKTGNFLFFFLSLGFSHIGGDEGRRSPVWDDLWLQEWLIFWQTLQEEPPKRASCNQPSFRETQRER